MCLSNRHYLSEARTHTNMTGFHVACKAQLTEECLTLIEVNRATQIMHSDDIISYYNDKKLDTRYCTCSALG